MHHRPTFAMTLIVFLITIGVLVAVSRGMTSGPTLSPSQDANALDPPTTRPSEVESGDAQAAWEELLRTLEERMGRDGASALPHVLNELLAFATRYEGTNEAAIALLSHGQLLISTGEIQRAEESLHKASTSARDPQLIAEIKNAIARIVLRPGGTPPKFSATTLDGRTVSLADYKDKIVLIDFWATWCGPCLQELPNVRRAYEKYHDDGFEILSVSLDRNETALRNFLKKTPMDWTHVYNANTPRGEDLATIYGVTSIPMTVLVGRDGRIAAMNMRGGQLETEITKALAGGKDKAEKPKSKKLEIGRARGPQNPNLGLLDRKAPAWGVDKWFNLADGETSADVEDYRGKVVYFYGFQSWCPGCHSHGFPTLQELIKRFDDEDDVVFVAVQTTFEGYQTNNAQSALKTAQRYNLDIPIGHSGSGGERSQVMQDYRTGGTPWTVIIDRDGIVRFNDFHITPDQATTLMKQLLAAKTS